MNQYFKNEEKYTRAATFLATQGERIGLTEEQMSRMKLTPTELYVASKIVAGGTAHLISGNTVQDVGVTNFDGNRLEDGRHFVIEALQLLYGEDEATAKVYDVKFKNGGQLEIPAVLAASHFVIRQSGEVIVNIPLASIIEAAKADGDKYRHLGALALLAAGKNVEIFIETPVGSTITPITSSKSSYVKVLLRGFQTLTKR